LSASKKKSAPPAGLVGDKTRNAILRAIAKAYPDAKCSLNFKTPLQLLVATILSAQCTDERVNKVTISLFKKYKTPASYANAPQGELEEDIRSTGFFNNKAKSIRNSCATIIEKFDGAPPNNMKDLLSLSGVARKTANVVLGNGFNIASGIVVDTHVSRLAQRMGLTIESTPDKIESALIEIIPKKNWILFSHQMILHGRQVCMARKPDCGACMINKLCPSSEPTNEA